MGFYRSAIHKARKSHKCNLCRLEITKGEKYLAEASVYEGGFFAHCLHLHCKAVINDYCRTESEDSYDFDGVKDWARDRFCYECDGRGKCGISVFECETLINRYSGGSENDYL